MYKDGCFFFFFHYLLAYWRYLLQLARSTLLHFRMQIFANISLNIRKRRNTPAKFGILSNLSSTNIYLLIFQKRFYTPYVSSHFIDDFYDSFVHRILASFISPIYMSLSCQIILYGSRNTRETRRTGKIEEIDVSLSFLREN